MKLMQIDDGIWTGRRANVEAINNLIRMHVCVCVSFAGLVPRRLGPG